MLVDGSDNVLDKRGGRMKRSEAIKKLQDIILKHMNCPSDCCGDDAAMYSKILADIELRIEMTPPLTFTDPFYENVWEEE